MYNNIPQQTPAYYYMPQNYSRPQQELQMQMYPQQQNYIKGRPVVSIDEAKASQIDFDGSLFVFPDIGNKKIYTKQINIDGTATFNVFTLAEGVAQDSAQKVDYVTRAELDSILSQFKESLTSVAQTKTNTTPIFNL